MSLTPKVRHRHLLRKKELTAVFDELQHSFPMEVTAKNLETAEIDNQDVLLQNGKVFAFKQDGRYVPSLRILLEKAPERMHVTVDMGAVRFVANGADIMSPGIVSSDPEIKKDDLVWIRDEKNLRPLAIGLALMSGSEMVESSSGKAIKTLHYVGDKYWELQL